VKFFGVISLGACLLAACDRAPDAAAPAAPKRFVYVNPPPPKATHVPEGMAEWLKLLSERRAKIEALRQQVQAVSTTHQETAFDELLKLDPYTLNNDQLCYLWHFADKGYFTVEREIMVRILQDRKERPVFQTSATNIAERAAQLAERYENELLDLEIALSFYVKPEDALFSIPNTMTDEQTEILRGMVNEKLIAARATCAALDEQIRSLQAEMAPE
jgi:hypothetical protein